MYSTLWRLIVHVPCRILPVSVGDTRISGASQHRRTAGAAAHRTHRGDAHAAPSDVGAYADGRVLVRAMRMAAALLLALFSGLSAGRVQVYKGVRYALPPTGARRFMPAVEAPLETSVSYTTFGHDCIQAGRADKIGEDCLFLNIWKPSQAEQRLVPVMLWVHGGGYSFGAGRDYDGSVLAASQGVVVVTMNYRLGALGFYASEALLRETSTHTSTPTTGGMNGIFDVVVALQWLHRNIAHFGGDASQLTVFGQSAGALSICTLLVSPQAKGLFRRA